MLEPVPGSEGFGEFLVTKADGSALVMIIL